MSPITDRILSDVLYSEVMAPLLGTSAKRNAAKWRFLHEGLKLLEKKGLLLIPDTDAASAPTPHEGSPDMSNDFKPGDRVRRVRGEYAGMTEGDEATVKGICSWSLALEEYEGDHDPSVFAPLDPLKGTPYEGFGVERVKTPAPRIDPSKVKAGDTVTVLVQGDNDTPVKPYEMTGEVYSWGGLHMGNIPLESPLVTLTDHQPAPERTPAGLVISEDGELINWRGENYVRQPDPEPEPDRVGFLYDYLSGRGDVDLLVGLVVIDPAKVDVDALAKVIRDAVKMNPTIWKHAAFQVMTHLGIEAS